jgi:hypothetical protein
LDDSNSAFLFVFRVFVFVLSAEFEVRLIRVFPYHFRRVSPHFQRRTPRSKPLQNACYAHLASATLAIRRPNGRELNSINPSLITRIISGQKSMKFTLRWIAAAGSVFASGRVLAGLASRRGHELNWETRARCFIRAFFLHDEKPARSGP